MYHTFITEGKRQKPITAKDLGKWASLEPQYFCETKAMLENHKRNKELIDFNFIPKDIANSIKEDFGNLDGILHAIAFSPTEAMGGNFMNTSIEDASTSFEVSAFSLKTLSQGFKSLLNNPASIVALDFDNSQSWPGYDWQGVAKSGLQSVVRYLAYYMGEDGVRVNAVSAGPLATTAAKNIPGFGEMNDEWDQKAPLGWDSKDAIPVAKVVNFLLSEYSEAVSGEIIHADGGAHSVGGTMLP